jgi:hypothetical protein
MFFSWKTCNVSEKMLVYNWRISYTQELSPSLGWPIKWARPDVCCMYIYVYIDCQAEALEGRPWDE